MMKEPTSLCEFMQGVECEDSMDFGEKTVKLKGRRLVDAGRDVDDETARRQYREYVDCQRLSICMCSDLPVEVRFEILEHLTEEKSAEFLSRMISVDVMRFIRSEYRKRMSKRPHFPEDYFVMLVLSSYRSLPTTEENQVVDFDGLFRAEGKAGYNYLEIFDDLDLKTFAYLMLGKYPCMYDFFLLLLSSIMYHNVTRYRNLPFLETTFVLDPAWSEDNKHLMTATGRLCINPMPILVKPEGIRGAMLKFVGSGDMRYCEKKEELSEIVSSFDGRMS